MFTGFGNIFSVTSPRHAENTDAKLGLKKHEIDKDRKKKKDTQDHFSEFDLNDDMSVSAKALKVFLENVLASEEEKKHIYNSFDKAQNPKNMDAESETSHEENTIQPRVNGESAYAAGIYQSRANYDTAASMASALSKNKSLQDYSNLMNGADIRRIHTMIEDLRVLIMGGIDDLHLEKNDTFLSALEAAIQKTKDSF